MYLDFISIILFWSSTHNWQNVVEIDSRGPQAYFP